MIRPLFYSLLAVASATIVGMGIAHIITWGKLPWHKAITWGICIWYIPYWFFSLFEERENSVLRYSNKIHLNTWDDVCEALSNGYPMKVYYYDAQ